MSYILDALNKSEQERKELDQAPGLQAIHLPSDATLQPHPLHSWFPALVAGAAIGIFLLASNLYNRPPLGSPTPPQPPVAATLAQLPPPASGAPAVRGVENNNAVTALYRERPGEPAEEVAGEPTTTKQAEPAPSLLDSMLGSTSSEAQLQQLMADIDALDPPSDVPAIYELSIPLRRQLPDLDYSAHIFSATENSGFVILNGKPRYTGDLVGQGLFVEQIEEDGVVLNFQGKSFKLPSMRSWRRR